MQGRWLYQAADSRAIHPIWDIDAARNQLEERRCIRVLDLLDGVNAEALVLKPCASSRHEFGHFKPNDSQQGGTPQRHGRGRATEFASADGARNSITVGIDFATPPWPS